ncbi:DUF3994 domain-containing protein [Evansella cellulosilytica]|uniref:Uncharacterized protein n=1 Tax=Evansella cellulosilytica (strain ATCC 21833 / DSM 2522 / FERM P-1141 / JCM 9156 / N-4) TaxID=649639 RepID=E6TYB9_EVAC2|nr:DUF3994 domain-containing protein [Evansella cellulosilytica]ADU28857.1 hypothetical protein Bcell_0575 [Evansella cellulosilytica DSM 2522]
MKKLFVYLLITCIFTIGCSAEETESQDEIDEVIENEEQEFEQLSKEEYVETIGELQQKMQKELEEWVVISHDYSSNTYVEQNQQQIDVLLSVVEKYKELAAPEEFAEVQSYYVKGMNLFEEGFGLYMDMLRNRDESLEETTNTTLKDGQDHWNYAFLLLSLKEPIPMGDGTITTDDMMSLDRLAGMDIESVINNISKDGSELVGKWGFYYDDESFNVSIILHSDGSYEGYPNDAYPDDSNAMKGTWYYNYLVQELVISNDEYFEDGESIEPPRPNMIMEIQSFVDGELLMMDKESLNSFLYVQEGEIRQDRPTSEKESDESIVNSDGEIARDSSYETLIGTWSYMNLDHDEYRAIYIPDRGDGYYMIRTPDLNVNFFGEWNYDEESSILTFSINNYDLERGEFSGQTDQLTFHIHSQGESELEVEESGNTFILEKDF